MSPRIGRTGGAAARAFGKGTAVRGKSGYFSPDTGSTLTTSLLSYYTLSANSTDLWGTSNGTDTSISYTTGKVGNGAIFNGSTSQIALGVSAFDFEYNTAFSAAFWYKSSSNGNQTLLTKNTNWDNAPTYNSGWSIFIAAGGNGAIYCQLATGNSSYKQQSSTYPNAYNDGAWHFVVVTYDGSTNASGVNIYVDNVSRKTGSDFDTLGSNSIRNSTSMQFGKDTSGAHYLAGGLDEIGIWTKVLSGTEMTDLYNGGTGQTLTIL